MDNGISFKMVTEKFDVGIADRRARMPAAGMWAVRQAGRVARRTAVAKAPVLVDKTRSSYSTIRARQRRGLTPAAETFARPIPGLLRGSIRPARNVTRLGASSFSLRVGPRGERTHLYAQKAEAKHGYMAAGESAAAEEMPRIAAEAFNRVWKE